ncbi:MAG: ABC transporter permease [Proteobacteria bacterium]|nr:ABC transporter permease [Pseudomonadota bacterium]
MQSPPEPTRRRSSPRRRILTVARREFIATVTRVGYLVTLVAMPALLAAIALLPTVGVALSGGEEQLLGIKKASELTRVGVVDLADPPVILATSIQWHNDDQGAARAEDRQLPEHLHEPESDLPEIFQGDPLLANIDYGGFDGNRRLELVSFATREAAQEATLAGDVDEVFVLLPEYWSTSQITVLIPTERPLNPGAYSGKTSVARLIRHSLLAPRIDEPAVLERMLQVMEVDEEILDPTTDASAPGSLDQALATLVPVLFAMFFSMMIFVSSGYLLDGVGEEKENRVLEILLASVTAEELLLGKMVGLGAAGLLQSLFFAAVGLGPLLLLGGAGVGAMDIVAMFLCATLGFAMYASLMGASGAVAGNRHEGRQISAFWTLLAASPLFLLLAFMTGEDPPIAVALSLAPPTAPIAMTLRLGAGDVPMWQLGLSLALMAATAYGAWRVGSRVFRVAILMTGARPSLKQVWGWVRRG